MIVLGTGTDEALSAAMQANPELADRLRNAMPKAKALPPQVTAEMAATQGAATQVPICTAVNGYGDTACTANSASNAVWHASDIRRLAIHSTARRDDASPCTAYAGANLHRAQGTRTEPEKRGKTGSTAESVAGMTGTTTLGTAIGGKDGVRGTATHAMTGDWDDHQSRPQGSQAQPNWHDATESAPHVDVQREGWQWSFQLDERILRSKRNRPYYRNRKTCKFLCAIPCTATQCNHIRPPCNYTIQNPDDDRHIGHLCSYCRQELERRKAQHEARNDP